MIKNYIKHFKLVNKHKWYVFKMSVKAGIPFRGLMHDLSKFSYDEFIISAKNYDGNKSPIKVARDKYGCSTVWLHHKGRNKHHFEYWEDVSRDKRVGVFIPYKYIVEAICDKVGAGMAYKGKNWDNKEPFEYWRRVEKNNVVVKHPGSVEFVDTVLKKIYNEGINSALKKKYLKETYRIIEKKYNIKS